MGSFSRTSFLFPRPRLLFGAARILDLGGTFNLYNVSPTGEDADAHAMYNDWAAVSDDLGEAYSRLAQQEKAQGGRTSQG